MLSIFCLVGNLYSSFAYHLLKTRIINDVYWSTTIDNPVGNNVCNISFELGTNWLDLFEPHKTKTFSVKTVYLLTINNFIVIVHFQTKSTKSSDLAIYY